MRLGIDLTALWRRTTGKGRVAIELTRAMLNTDDKHDYVLFFSGETHSEFAEFKGRFREVIFPSRSELLCKHVLFPFSSELRNLDFLYFPVFPPPWRYPCSCGWAMPDATAWLWPETMTTRARFYFKFLGELAMSKCELIITDTHASKKDLQTLFGDRAQKVRVNHPGKRGAFQPIDDPDAFHRIRKKYQLPDEFVLCVATLEPRKNMRRLIQAFAMLKRDGRFRPSLVITGTKGWLYESIIEEVSSCGLDDEVLFTGYVPDEDLVVLYNMARVFAYPSLYEGFGLPCLEAMASGCPVVTSNRGALLEVTQGAALHAAPESVESIAEAIRKAHEDEPLRRELSCKGLERARMFSWETYAQEFLNLVRERVTCRKAAAGGTVHSESYARRFVK